MAPKYRLIYFDGRGRAEHMRFLFAYAGVDYEDVRVSREEWMKIKPTMPFGQLPVLEIDGVAYNQSSALGRHLARKFGLDGKDEHERLLIDVFVENIDDLKQGLSQWFREQDPKKKEELLKKVKEETVPFYMGKFEQTVAANGGFTVGKSISYSDFILALAWESGSSRLSLDGSKYPSVKALHDKVMALPGIKEWVQKRPTTEF